MIAVIFPKCGAESHPSFTCARFDAARGKYILRYPITNKEMLQSKKAQRRWGESKAEHVRSWGVQAEIVDLTDEDGTSEAMLADLETRVAAGAVITIQYEGRKRTIYRDQSDTRNTLFFVKTGSERVRMPFNAVCHMISLCEL